MNQEEKLEKQRIKAEKEHERLVELSKFEREYNEKGFELIGGIDEAGRGPLFGPVVAACVVLPKGCLIEGVNDSKKLSEKKREALFDEIKEKAVAWGVGIVDNNTIDEINILEATRKAMHEAVSNLQVKPDYIFIDAEKHVDTNGIPYLPIIKGDALSINISCASIIAKVTRDRMVDEYAKQYPEYGLEKHKGYGTKQHTDAIKQYGLTPLHRKTFCQKFI
ncbi:MAG: ribonuclease HII [Clostridia bacterium]|nr:ribonuclease HII [Clostridia bacterium]